MRLLRSLLDNNDKLDIYLNTLGLHDNIEIKQLDGILNH